MDYDTLEMIVGSTLVLPPIAAVAAYGWWCLKKPRARMAWFFFLAPCASVLYAWAAASLALKVFPPPYNAYFAGGRGLDLRGMIIVLGAMLGGGAGVLASLVLCTGNLVRQFIQERRDDRKADAPNTAAAWVPRR